MISNRAAFIFCLVPLTRLAEMLFISDKLEPERTVKVFSTA